MARYTGAVCRLCRREGKKLFLKGDRCYTDKCAVTKRNAIPGQHGKARLRKSSEYGLQLRAKQTAKRYYGVLESQFHSYFEQASNRAGVTGENLLGILESRLDNVVYRLGLGASRTQARQLVRHGHFLVNGRRVDIPSYLTRPGDVIAVCQKSKASDKFKELAENLAGRPVPKWLELDAEALSGKVLTPAAREDIDLDVAEQLIVELYSK